MTCRCCAKNEVYKLLSDARELLGKAHDKIADAVVNHGGEHQLHVSVKTCNAINDLIEQVNDACGVAG